MNLPSNDTSSTVAYYDAHATEFCQRTISLDMSELYAPFLREIPAGGRILDAGCGSGRDSLAFLKAGYDVVSIDASLEMVKATSKLTRGDALLLAFDGIEFINEFDGIWACASLLHVARRKLNSVLVRLIKALKPNGVLYVSFKYGDSERMEGGRFFDDLNETLLAAALSDHPQLELLGMWVTNDVRNERRGGQQWLNAIVRRGQSVG
jgi:SAM-dependent methyltransferase